MGERCVQRGGSIGTLWLLKKSSVEGMMPDLSFFVPAYDEEESIGNVLERLPMVIQSSWKVEVVVVDDESADGTSRETGAFPFVKHIHHEIKEGNTRAVTSRYLGEFEEKGR